MKRVDIRIDDDVKDNYTVYLEVYLNSQEKPALTILGGYSGTESFNNISKDMAKLMSRPAYSDVVSVGINCAESTDLSFRDSLSKGLREKLENIEVDGGKDGD